MIVTVNGEPRPLDPDSAVVTAVESVGGGTGTAVAVNGEVVPRSEWSQRALADGDSVEVLSAVPGG